MANVGGKRPGAGRPKGSQNRRTKALKEIADKAVAAGVTPLEVMLDNMRFAMAEAANAQQRYEAAVDPKERKEARGQVLGYRGFAQDAAKEAAPFVHPKLAAVEVTGKDGEAVQHVHTIRRIVVDPGQG